MTVIVGTAINNPLFIPASGANLQTGEAVLPMPDEETAFAMLFQNAENGLTADIVTGEGEAAFSGKPIVLKQQKDEQQDLNLLGFAAVNFLMSNPKENPVPEKTDGKATTVSVGAVDSEVSGKPTNALNPAFMNERVQVSKVSQAEPEQVQSFKASFNTAFGTNPEVVPEGTVQADSSVVLEKASLGRAGRKDFLANIHPEQKSAAKALVGQNSGVMNQAVSMNPEAKTEPKRAAFFVEFSDGASENAVKDISVPAESPASLQSVSFGRVVTEEETAANPQLQDNAFQSNLKAIRTELEAKTGLRQSKAESMNVDTLTDFKPIGDVAAKQTQPQDIENTDGLAAESKTVQSAGTKTKPGFELSFRENADTGTERLSDLNTETVQNSAQVQGSSAAEVQETKKQTVDDLAAQLEAPIKREASKGVNTSLKIKLKPEGLGEVTVDLKHVSGKLEVTIKTEMSSTKELISEGINTLRNALSTDDGPKALTLASLTVEQDGRQSFGQSGFGGDRQRWGFSGSTLNSFRETDGQKTCSTARFKTGLIDYTV